MEIKVNQTFNSNTKCELGYVMSFRITKVTDNEIEVNGYSVYEDGNEIEVIDLGRKSFKREKFEKHLKNTKESKYAKVIN